MIVHGAASKVKDESVEGDKKSGYAGSPGHPPAAKSAPKRIDGRGQS